MTRLQLRWLVEHPDIVVSWLRLVFLHTHIHTHTRTHTQSYCYLLSCIQLSCLLWQHVGGQSRRPPASCCISSLRCTAFRS